MIRGEIKTSLSLWHTVTTGSSKQFLKERGGHAEYVVRSLPTTTYVHTDGLRSPVVETDANGVRKSGTRYEPYGAPATGLYVQGPGYTGHVTDENTKLTYMQQRYYDPMAGRFLSVDPVEANAGSFNRYWYANNNPYTNIDPDGRFVQLAWGALAGLLSKCLCRQQFKENLSLI